MTPAAAIASERTRELGVGPVAQLSGEDAAKLAHPSHAVRPADLAIAERLIASGRAARQPNGKIRIAGRVDGAPWVVILKVTSEGETVINALHRIDAERLAAWGASDLDA